MGAENIYQLYYHKLFLKEARLQVFYNINYVKGIFATSNRKRCN